MGDFGTWNWIHCKRLLFSVAVFFVFPSIEASAESGKPLRIGLVHPRPRLCQLQEPGAQDRRVLRWVYGIQGNYSGQPSPPHFLHARPPKSEGHPGFALIPSALWNMDSMPTYSVDSASSDQLQLEIWHKVVTSSLPVVNSEEQPLVFWYTQPPGPFVWSRLASTDLLPWRAEKNWECRDWPSGTVFSKSTRGFVYQIEIPTRGEIPGVLILAYESSDKILARVGLDNLDLVWSDGIGYETLVSSLPPIGWKQWHSQVGSQHLVLFPEGDTASNLGKEGMKALFLALNREKLARELGDGFEVIQDYLVPFKGQGTGLPQRNTGKAREIWLAESNRPSRVGLAVLGHPLLVNLARQVGAQWERTLNLKLFPMELSVARFEEHRQESEFSLHVFDLEDGSLQTLWERSIPEPVFEGFTRSGFEGKIAPKGIDKQSTGKEVGSSELEVLPYFPIAVSREFTYVASRKGLKVFPKVCNSCVLVKKTK